MNAVMIVLLVAGMVATAALGEVLAAVLPVLVALAVPPAERQALADLIAAPGRTGPVRRALTIVVHRCLARGRCPVR